MVSKVYSEQIVFPNKYQIEAQDNGNFAKISVYPLQKGFGTTIGNIFRRTLLSSIRGVVVDKIKIDGVAHEFSTIDGVMQNVCEIVYNLKRVVFKTDLEEVKLSLEVKGPKKVFASDIKLPSNVEIINPDHFLFEITSNEVVKIELMLCAGIGDKLSSTETEIGTIEFDKHFSPVLNVASHVLQATVGDVVDYDKLVLEIKTNGSITAEESFKMATSILSNFISSIDNINCNMLKTENVVQQVANSEKINYNLFRRIADLELSVRSLNCLRSENIEYLGDLVAKKEIDMIKLPNFGRKSLNELKTLLHNMNLYFGMDINWPPKNFKELELEAKKYI